jgi:putative heme-binding domain-containing protein
MRNPGISVFLNDKDEYIVTEAARAINDDLSIERALPALGDVLKQDRFRKEALIRRAISANLRVGSAESMRNLIDYAMRPGRPLAMRTEAIDALSTWAKPSVLDRVDGRFRGEVTRDAGPVRDMAATPLIELMTRGEKAIRISAVRATGKLRIAAGSKPLFARLKSDPDAEVRSEALKALAVMEDPQTGEAIKYALGDKEKSVRVVALDLLPKTDMPKDVMVALLSEVIKTRTPEEKQAALITMGGLPAENTEKVLDTLLTKMSQGKLSPEIHLELQEAIDSTGSTSLKKRYEEITVNLSPDSLKAAYSGVLAGGDIDKGRNLFFRDQTAQCMRCHSFNDFGGDAGPRLNGVAARLTPDQILQSLIEPSARIAPGFGIVTVKLNNGKTAAGILLEEKSDKVFLKVGERPDTAISKTNIVQLTHAPSSMPPMRYLLTKRQIRDLMSFLTTLKEDD